MALDFAVIHVRRIAEEPQTKFKEGVLSHQNGIGEKEKVIFQMFEKDFIG